MIPCRFFYPRMVIEFYHTMTSKQEPNLIAIHFAIDGLPRILRVTDIVATFNLLVVLANSADYRQWPHPSTREMVHLLSREMTTGFILFRRQLSPSMLFIDHILRSNLFPLQHLVQRRGAILEALYHISEGFWFSLAELIMTSLFHFKDKVHRGNLTRAESTPLLFPGLLCQVLEHIDFPTEPRLERRRDCEVVLTVDRWQIMPHSYHLPLQDPAEDQPVVDLPTEEQPPPLPIAPASSIPIEPSASSTMVHTDSAGPSTTGLPPQHISIFTRDFLAIMEAIRKFSATSSSFAAAHAALAERMTRTEVVVAQTSTIPAHNQVILV